MDLTTLVEKIKELKILTLGDVMLDVYDFCYTANSRPSPERPGRRVYKAEESLKRLGGAGNVAANLSSLGVSSVLVSICGEDGYANILEDLSKEQKIHYFYIQEKERISTLKTRLYIDDEYLLRRDDEVSHTISDSSQDAVLQAFNRELKGSDAVIFSDYNKGFFSEKTAQTMIEMCNARGIPIVVDFKPPNKHFFRGATLIAPNFIEAQTLAPDFVVDENIETHAKQLHEKLACKNLVVTLGKFGQCAYDGVNFEMIPANKVNAVDSVGCGDTVRAALALGFALGFSLRDSCKLANAAAAIVVQKIGTASLTLDELTDFIKERKITFN